MDNSLSVPQLIKMVKMVKIITKHRQNRALRFFFFFDQARLKNGVFKLKSWKTSDTILQNINPGTFDPYMEMPFMANYMVRNVRPYT